jgi:hypothetical protein|tara:strand:+ start:53 stop:298 length:246 start_codon:yes stop_codon:yes gene_type:complete
MIDEKTGGPAFPLVAQNWHHKGMSLRDYFAAHALQGFIACNSGQLGGPGDRALIGGRSAEDAVSSAAYRYADEMLKARGEK